MPCSASSSTTRRPASRSGARGPLSLERLYAPTGIGALPCMIPRTLTPTLLADAGTMPVVALTGPRQSGKTTLRRATFPDHAYVSLEPIATRDFAASDPRGFLSQYSGPVILDEVQRVPDFFSYIQEEVDRAPEHGRFILTGSEHFRLSQAISQSLAGRIRLPNLLPLSL